MDLGVRRRAAVVACHFDRVVGPVAGREGWMHCVRISNVCRRLHNIGRLWLARLLIVHIWGPRRSTCHRHARLLLSVHRLLSLHRLALHWLLHLGLAGHLLAIHRWASHLRISALTLDGCHRGSCSRLTIHKWLALSHTILQILPFHE